MIKNVTLILGAVMVSLGLLGFVLPNIVGLHLTFFHNIFHLGLGIWAIYLSLKATPKTLLVFCLLVGIIYLILGTSGFVFGSSKTQDVAMEATSDHVIFVPPLSPDDHWLPLLNGKLAFGTSDHIFHLTIGFFFVGTGLISRRSKNILID